MDRRARIRIDASIAFSRAVEDLEVLHARARLENSDLLRRRIADAELVGRMALYLQGAAAR